MRNLALVFLIGFGSGSVAACGGSAGIDESALVGTWARLEDDGVTVRDQFVFGADHSFAFDEYTGSPNEDHITGTWTFDGTTMFVDATSSDGTPLIYELGIYANATHLVVGAGYPIGDHEGVYGTWRTTVYFAEIDAQGQEVNPYGGTTELDIRSDDTATITRIDRDGQVTEVIEANHEITQEGQHRVYYQPTPDLTIGLVFDLIDDAVIGSASYLKQ